MNPHNETPRDRSPRLRAESAPEERKLWQHLRARRFAGFKFRRQHRIGPYYTDLCCIEQRLVIEIDGEQHAERNEEDADRTVFITQQGYRVIRFWNRQINREMAEVLDAIYLALTDSQVRLGRREKGPSRGA